MNILSLEKIFEKYPITASEVAKVLDVTKSAVYSWRSGKRNIDSARLKLLNQYVDRKYENQDTLQTTLPNRSFAGDIDLRRFRKGMNLGQGDLAEVLGKSQSWISQVENDQARLTDDQERQLLAKWPEAELYRKYAIESHSTKEDVEMWRKRVEDLEARIKDKEEIINLLKQNNALLKERAEFPEENDHDNHKAG